MNISVGGNMCACGSAASTEEPEYFPSYKYRSAGFNCYNCWAVSSNRLML